MLLIYVAEINERIEYTFSFIFEQVLGIPVQFTDSPQFFQEQTTPKLSYSIQAMGKEPHFFPSRLLFENDIKEQEINELIKDPFAVCFYLLTRYEEYLPFKKDQHERFSWQVSALKDKIDVTHPWIDEFAYRIYEQLKNDFPAVEKKDRRFRFINTIDIDHAWLYKNRSWKRNLLSFVKKITTLKVKEALNQMNILLGIQPDPYYIYPYVQHLQIPSLYFISFGKAGRWDTNHSPDNKNYQKLIKELDKDSLNTLGLHPSYGSNFRFEILEKEKTELEKIVSKSIIRSRQHFIKLKFPETYTNLLSIGIKEDYSMGFQDHIGFRSGTCTPFQWFDLTKNKVTTLTVYPFCVMDVTLKNYMKLSKEEAERVILELVDSVKKVDGTFISVFHNDSISGYGEWEGWEQLYEKLILIGND